MPEVRGSCRTASRRVSTARAPRGIWKTSLDAASTHSARLTSARWRRIYRSRRRQVTGRRVIARIGFDAGIDTSALEVNADILYDGKKHRLTTSAHNPELCIDEIVVAKLAPRSRTWSGRAARCRARRRRRRRRDRGHRDARSPTSTSPTRTRRRPPRRPRRRRQTQTRGRATPSTPAASCVEATEVLIYPCPRCEIDNACRAASLDRVGVRRRNVGGRRCVSLEPLELPRSQGRGRVPDGRQGERARRRRQLGVLDLRGGGQGR